jgi:DNA polymerase-1
MYTRCLLTPVLADIEWNGMYLDPELVLPMLEQKEAEYSMMEEQLSKLSGGINLNSGKQLGEFLFDKLKIPVPKDRRGEPLLTATGAYRTDADTISHLKPRNKKQKEFLDAYAKYRDLHSELTKYLRKFGECCQVDDGHLVAKFNQTTTRTHRLSSSGARYSTQFQNLPRVYKPLFRSRQPGWAVYEADGAQLEFRVAAHLGRDAVAVEHIRGGVDIHSNTADIIGCSRQEAKAHTFKPLYGGSSGTADEQRYYRHFKETYKGIAGAQDRWVNTVLKEKKLVTEWGLTFYWPDTKM